MPNPLYFGGRFTAGETGVRVRGDLLAGGTVSSTKFVFCDDFERADGPLGANWTQALRGPLSFPIPSLHLIESGAAYAQSVTPTDGSYSFYAQRMLFPKHYVQVSIRSMGGGGNIVEALIAFDLATFSGMGWQFVTQTSAPVGLEGNLRFVFWDDGHPGIGTVVHLPNPTVIRIERVSHLHFLLKADGVLYDEVDWSGFGSLTDSYVGMRAYTETFETTGNVSPRIERFCTGEL